MFVARAKDVTIVRLGAKRRAAFAASAITIAATIALVLVGLASESNGTQFLALRIAFLPAGLMISFVAWAMQLAREPSARTLASSSFGRGKLEIGHDAIRVTRGDARTLIPRSEITDGWIEKDDEDTLLIARTRSNMVVAAHFDELEAAKRALQEAGLDARQRVLRVELASRASIEPAGTQRGLFYVLAGVFFAFVGAAIGLFGVVFDGPNSRGAGVGVAVFLVAAFLLFRNARRIFATPWVTVGTEGVTVEASSSRRFIPFSQVQKARVLPNGVRLEGANVTLFTGPASDPKVERRDVLVARIREAMRSSSDATAEVLAKLERRGRDVATWRRDVKKMLEGDEGYRSRVVDFEEVASVLNDGNASPEHRLGAALALAGNDRSKLRVALDACAHRPLRVALEKALDGELDDEAFAEALAHEPRAASR